LVGLVCRGSLGLPWIGVESLAGVYDTLSLIAHPYPVTLTMLVEKNAVDDHVEVTYRVEAEQWTSIVKRACMRAVRRRGGRLRILRAGRRGTR
jgi:hypothetical protein